MSNNLFRNPAHVFWSICFAVVCLWTLSGALPGYFFPEWAYQTFQGRSPESPEVLDLFRGAWGQTLLFALGYGLAALDPVRHGALALLGAIGKVLFALRLLSAPGTELTVSSWVAVSGDLLLASIIFAYAFGTGQVWTYFGRGKP